MSPDEVAKRVGDILEMRGDDEAAHSAEDRLYRDVLRAIALGTTASPAACAQIALRTQGIAFARWCA